MFERHRGLLLACGLAPPNLLFTTRPFVMTFDASLAETVRTFQALTSIRPAIDRAGDIMLATLQRGGKFLICGNGGGKAKGLATCDLTMPGNSGAAAQEAHLFLIHHFCERIDEAFPS